MPIPLLILVPVLIGSAGGAYGAKKMHDAKNTANEAETIYKQSKENVEKQSRDACKSMDRLGQLELEILQSFNLFSDLIAQIQNKPKFSEINQGGYEIPQYDPEKLKEVSIGAALLLAGISAAGLGAAGGFAAAGATTAAIIAFGTASTGTTISTLSGAAATNAALAALGGGSLAAGGGGIAAGAAFLGGVAAGAFLVVGGAILAFMGSKTAKKADDMMDQALRAKNTAEILCSNLRDISEASKKYFNTLKIVRDMYNTHICELRYILRNTGYPRQNNKVNFSDFIERDKEITENTIRLAGLLYQMCKVKIVKKEDGIDSTNTVNSAEINKEVNNAERIIKSIKRPY